MSPSKAGWRNAPIVYALCQVRFSTILAIQDAIPKFQPAIQKDFPRYDDTPIQAMEIDLIGGQLGARKRGRWAFTDREQRSGFIIHDNSFVYHTTSYTTFEDFCESLEKGLLGFANAAEPTLVERVGVRFVDFITADGQHHLGEYLHDSLHGPPFADMPVVSEVIQRQEQILVKTEIGQFNFRSSRGRHAAPLPADIGPINLKIPRTAPATEPSALLDFDHFSDEPFDFSVPEIMTRARALQDVLGKMFKLLTSQWAQQQWK